MHWPLHILASTPPAPGLLLAAAMGVACSLLSVFVVLHRWAFLTDGIAHAGFGGAGTAWMLSLLLPACGLLRSEGGIYAVAAGFSLVAAVGLGYATRHRSVPMDTAAGILLVGSMAWGFLAFALYRQLHHGLDPPGWDGYLLGRTTRVSGPYLTGCLLVAAAVTATVLCFLKELLSCAVDPVLAQTAGVPSRFIHYVLVGMVASVIVLGMRLMGSLLITGLLVVPGTAALACSRRLGTVFVIATACGASSAVTGCALSSQWPFLPEGPAIAAVLLAELATVLLGRRLARAKIRRPR